MNQLPREWRSLLKDELAAPYFKSLMDHVAREYDQHTCYPPEAYVYKAFEYCAPEEVKVVILGQDPYHGEGQAHGLCFSVNEGVKHPPSLVNIFKEIHADTGNPVPVSGDLTHWAQQGVLLLNATLTVRASQAGSHQGKGWERFTDQVIARLSASQQHVVFMLWGGYARKKKKLINREKHLILECGHPSPLSANRGYWFGNGHFSQCNTWLKNKNRKPIEW
ncbi:uracil-DNA glycosylase [Robertkochia sediminum]|uniref:uracil-DNA glycosylase n=1 Tax=Robertkochia sediminum TaxID=2785326 RepID=UPI0019315E79|nr:uracil-DNA glycosylase [Robertkochia sediminum]MBL7473523.1 uracil-DNA glycosylase [Robertkochia sediminum]